jgi:methyl-accepting chemotaxis protein
MKNMTLGTRLAVVTGALVALILALGGFSIYALTNIADNAKTLATNNVKKLDICDDISVGTADVVSWDRAIMLRIMMNDPATSLSYRTEWEAAAQKVEAGVAKLEPLLQTEEGRRLFATLRDSFNKAKASHHEMTGAIDHGERDRALDILAKELVPAARQAGETSKKVTDIAATQAADLSGSASATADSSRWISIVSLIVACLIAVGSGFVIRNVSAVLRGIVVELRQGAEQVVSASSQVSGASQTLSQGATEQAASLEETSASMEEFSSMAKQNAENTRSASQFMGDVDRRVQESDSSLQKMVTSMAAIQESSVKVSKIIKTIDEIAFQTNILALNAAVEAARAGDAGMGFAVVADEVRNLAQRSAQAAKDTAALIEESNTRAKDGSAMVEHVGSSIAGITESVSKVKRLIDEVSNASEQQKDGIVQVSGAIVQMEQVTQSTAATAEESAAASEELNAQAEATMAVVDRLQQLVGGGNQQHGATAVPAAARPAKAATVVSIAKRHAHGKATPAPEETDLAPTGTFGNF